MLPFTRLGFLLLLLGRLFLLALPLLLGTCLPSLWSKPFPLHDSALIPVHNAKVRLSLTLTFSLLMIWCSGQIALFLFLSKAALASLPTVLFVALRPPSPFRPVQCVFPLKIAPFCKLFAGLCSIKSLPFSSSLTLALSSPPCLLLRLFFLPQTPGRSGKSCLLSPTVLSSDNEFPNTGFSRGTTRLISWPDGERYLCPPQSLIASLLLSLVFTLFFSRTGGVLFHLNSLTHRFLRFPPRNLRFLVTLAVSFFIIAATDTAYC